MAVYHRKWFKIGAGAAGTVATLVGLFLFLMNTYGFEITGTDDFCAGTVEDSCRSYINVTNPSRYNVDVYNQNGIKLQFSPEVEQYYLFKKDGRCRGGGSCAAPNGLSIPGWNFIDFTNETKPLSGKVYVYRFPAHTTKEFLLYGLKANPADRVKWTFGIDANVFFDEELDPVWGAPEDKDVVVPVEPDDPIIDPEDPVVPEDPVIPDDPIVPVIPEPERDWHYRGGGSPGGSDDGIVYEEPENPDIKFNYGSKWVAVEIYNDAGRIKTRDVLVGDERVTDAGSFERFASDVSVNLDNLTVKNKVKYGFDYGRDYSHQVWNITSSDTLTDDEDLTLAILLEESSLSFDGINSFSSDKWGDFLFTDLRDKNPNASFSLTKSTSRSYILEMWGVSDTDPSVIISYSSDPGLVHNFTAWDSINDTVRLDIYASLINFFDTNISYTNDSIDLSYYSNTGSGVEVTWNSTCGIRGGCLKFNASGSYVSLGNPLQLKSKNKTFMGWFYMADDPSGVEVLLSAAFGNYYFATNSGGRLRFTYRNSSGSVLSAHSSDILDPGLNHLTFSVNTTGENNWSVLFYINGSLKEQLNYTDGLDTSYGSNWYLGTYSGSSSFYNGSMDEVMFFSTALDDSEITSIYGGSMAGKVLKYRGSGDAIGYLSSGSSSSTRWINGSLFGMFDNDTSFYRDVDSGLVAEWGLDNSTNDLLGVANLTKNGNPTYSRSGRNGSFYFDGDGDYLNISFRDVLNISNGSSPTSACWMAWVKSEIESQKSSGFVLRTSGDAYGLVFSQGDMHCYVQNYSNSGFSTSPTETLFPGQWKHHACCVNGTHLTHSVDGEYYDGLAYDGSLSDNWIVFFVGYEGTADRYAEGFIDEIRIYNTSKSPDKIRNIYRASSVGKIAVNLSSSVDNSSFSSLYSNGNINLSDGFFTVNSLLPVGGFLKYKLIFDNPEFEFSALIKNLSFEYDDYCACPSPAANWTLNMSLGCTINSECNLTGYNVTLVETGNLTFNASVFVDRLINLSTRNIWFKQAAKFVVGQT